MLVPSVVPAMMVEAQDKLLLLVQINQRLVPERSAGSGLVRQPDRLAATYLRLAAGAAIGFILRLGASLAIARGDYQVGSLYDLAWIIPWLYFAWAAAESPVVRTSRAQPSILPDPPTPIASRPSRCC